jgi:ABC-type Fe3+ transport system permease subunit
MDNWIFNLALFASAACMGLFIILSVAGGILERSERGGTVKRGYEKPMLVLAFALFILLCFSVVPVIVGVFFPILQSVVPVDISIISENDMLFVYAFWAIIIVGFAIALPSMREGGFFGSGSA